MVINCAHPEYMGLSVWKLSTSPRAPRARKMSIAPPGSVVVLLPSMNVTATRAGLLWSAKAWSAASRREIELFSFITSYRALQLIQTGHNVILFA